MNRAWAQKHPRSRRLRSVVQPWAPGHSVQSERSSTRSRDGLFRRSEGRQFCGIAFILLPKARSCATIPHPPLQTKTFVDNHSSRPGSCTIRSYAYAAVSGNSSPENLPVHFPRYSSPGQNFPSKFSRSRSVFPRYFDAIEYHSNNNTVIVANDLYSWRFLTPVTRPDISKTLALYKSCTYLLTYLLTFDVYIHACERIASVVTLTSVYRVASEKCYRATIPPHPYPCFGRAANRVSNPGFPESHPLSLVTRPFSSPETRVCGQLKPRFLRLEIDQLVYVRLRDSCVFWRNLLCFFKIVSD